MTFVANRPVADPEIAARKLLAQACGPWQNSLSRAKTATEQV
jgi:hypothetical protein